VFDPERRPWIDPLRATAVEIAAAIERCPTGALHYESAAGPSEPVLENRVLVAADGPLYVSGDVQLKDANGAELLADTRVALCRCGASENKPLCDGRHADVGFRDAGDVAGVSDAADGTSGALAISVARNGPLLLDGVHRVAEATGGDRGVRRKGALCRCGQSATKPFCDGAHARVGFRPDGS
jgi:CDGSH-type Zn-finger protein